MYAKSVTVVRWLLGLQFLLSGGNWFYKMLPYPNLFDDRSIPLKYKVVEGMIATGWMFQLAKVIEVLTAASLLLNLYVPLMLVASMSVTLTTFIMDAWNCAPLLDWLSGSGTFAGARAYLLDAVFFGGAVLVMQGYLMFNYLHVYRPMLSARADARPPQGALGGDGSGRVTRLLMTLLAPLAIALGVLSTGWLIGMVHQWLIPWSSFAIFLVPRG
jgi:hypothetical protein